MELVIKMNKLDFILTDHEYRKAQPPKVKKLTLPIYVIAGKYDWAKQWAIEHGISNSDYQVIINDEHIRGIRDVSCTTAQLGVDRECMEILLSIVNYAKAHNFTCFTGTEIDKEYPKLKGWKDE